MDHSVPLTSDSDFSGSHIGDLSAIDYEMGVLSDSYNSFLAPKAGHRKQKVLIGKLYK